MLGSLKARMLGAAFGVIALGGVAHAEDGPTITGNVALTTDYLFRGISQSESNAAVQGGLDLTWDIFYAGTWASSIDFTDLNLPASMELDLYAGLRPTLGPLALDFGVIEYAYPNADEGAGGYGEMNYLEIYGKASGTISPGVTLGVAVNYSPEFTLKTGKAWYVEGNFAATLSSKFALSGAVGYQDIEDVTGVFNSVVAPFAATRGDAYTTWNIGVTYSNWGLGFDLRYVDTDIDSSDPIIQEFYALKQSTEPTAVFTIKKSL